MTANPPMLAPPNLQPFAAERSLSSGLNIHYYEAGAKSDPAIVLVHGLGDEADTWRHVILPLSREHRVVALDLPGFGRSGHPHRAYTLVFFARAVAELLATLHISRATLVGSSLGAAVVQRLALARPTLAQRLVLLGGGLPITRRWPRGKIWAYLAPGVGELAYTSLRQSQDEAYATLYPYYADLDSLPLEDRAFLRERVWARVWSANQRRAFLSALRWLAVERAFRSEAFRARLATLDVPTLLLWGEHDHIVPWAEAEALAAILPNAQLQSIRGAGHLPQQERPDVFVEAIKLPLPQLAQSI